MSDDKKPMISREWLELAANAEDNGITSVGGLVYQVLPCDECGGVGDVDSGGVTPWGEWINVPCECRCYLPPPAAKEEQ